MSKLNMRLWMFNVQISMLCAGIFACIAGDLLDKGASREYGVALVIAAVMATFSLFAGVWVADKVDAQNREHTRKAQLTELTQFVVAVFASHWINERTDHRVVLNEAAWELERSGLFDIAPRDNKAAVWVATGDEVIQFALDRGWTPNV